MAETTNNETPGTTSRGFLQSTSSYVDFTNLTSEIYTEEGKATAHDYHPHSERKIKKAITDFESVIHMLKGSIGAGILTMPKAFSNGGIVLGIVGTPLIGFLCVYALTTLIRMQYIQCQRLKVPFLTYPMSLKIALINGPKCLRPLACMATVAVDFFLVTVQLGLCTAFIIFMADSLKSVMEPRFLKNVDLQLYLLAIFMPVLIINFIRNLKHLSPISLIANILIIVAFSSCFYYIFFVGPWKTETCNLVSSVTTWPLFIGTVLFSIEAVGVVIAVEHNSKNPQHFLGYKGLFPWSMVVVVSFYMLVGLVGYLKYGDHVQGTIVASLPQEEWLSISIAGVYAMCIYGTYPLQMYVVIEILWGNYIWFHVQDSNKQHCYEYLLRIICVLITFVLALLIPQIDIIISLMGAFSLSSLGISFPFLIEMCTLYPDQLSCFTFLKDLILIIFGFFILVIGTYVALHTVIAQ